MTNQDKIVIQYLIKKKLPIDLLAEVHDHMMSQIYALQASGDSFDIAFEKTKKCWKDDLKIVPGQISGYDNSIFTKRIYRMHLKGTFIKALKWGGLSYVLFGVIAYLTNSLFFKYSLYGALGIVLTLSLYHFYKQTKSNGKLIKKYDNYKLSIFNNLPYATTFTIASIPQICFWADSYYTMYMELIHQGLTGKNLLLSALLILLFTIMSMNFYFIHKLNRSYHRIQPYLQFLTPNRFYVD